MDRIYVIFKDGKPFKTKHGKNSYTQKRHAKKVITEDMHREMWKDIADQEITDIPVPDEIINEAENCAKLRYTIEVFKREV